MPSVIRKPPARGRPKGATSFDPETATAFGAVVRQAREALGQSQEALAAASGLERSHFGKLERGQLQPTLSVVFKIAAALEVAPAVLIDRVASEIASATLRR